MKWFCDGSGFNGQVSKFGIRPETGGSTVMVFSKDLSVNVMEYSAIVLASIVAAI